MTSNTCLECGKRFTTDAPDADLCPACDEAAHEWTDLEDDVA